MVIADRPPRVVGKGQVEAVESDEDTAHITDDAGVGVEEVADPAAPEHDLSRSSSASKSTSTTLSRRCQMYALFIISILTTKTIRFALPSLLPTMALELGYTESQSASVLAAFFPG
jgi:hypothetical protein